MRRVITLRLILLAAVLFSLLRLVIGHAAHVGPVEWLVVGLLVAALVLAMLRAPRRAV